MINSMDIVNRLRVWADEMERQKSAPMSLLLNEAADNIEELRRDKDEAKHDLELMQNSVRLSQETKTLQNSVDTMSSKTKDIAEQMESTLATLAQATEEINRLRRERDQARREICELIVNNDKTPEQMAVECRWDCFKEKEEADANNDEFRRNYR